MGQLILVLRALLNAVDWATLRVSGGYAEGVPEHLLELVSARTESDAERAYWRLDNHVVVQGRAFGAAAALVPALCVATSSSVVADCSRRWLVELLTEIALADCHEEEPNQREVEQALDQRLGEGLWVIYGLLSSEDAQIRRAALEVLRRKDRRSIVPLEVLGSLADGSE